MRARDHLFVDGDWVRPASSATIDLVNPATEEVMGHVPDASAADVDGAVAAARAAFEGWAATPVDDRAKLLERMAEVLVARLPEIGFLVAEEVGCPLSFATLVQVGGPLMVMGSFAEVARTYPFEEEVGLSLVVREPVGVVAAITPWNYPLLQAVQKVAAALAAGCTVVLKPSELAPLTAFVLADAAEEVGLPAGVLNLVTGRGPVGEALVSHPDVDLVSFTGSSGTGARVAALAAGGLKRVVLELGGKSANVVLDDADLDEAVRAGVRQCFMNAGQTCVAWSRMIVPRARHDEAAGLAADVAATYVLGDPMDAETSMGPVISDAQRARVRAAISGGVAEGATLVAGGVDRPAGLERGFFVRPTVFSGAANRMAVAREEVFGPVVALIPHDGDDDAVAIANDSPYGLAGAVFSRDRERALAVGRRLRTGMVGINGGGFDALAPWGGYKRSGLGREQGRFGLEEYLEVKSVQR
ncbi:MAG: aldehyde dehydrogenase [Actinomycetota bacterium]|jgi:betaine-aldehyde dehydrogenase|nr:aldehyde dehydrogenase [Actinomycetota bacterium]